MRRTQNRIEKHRKAHVHTHPHIPTIDRPSLILFFLSLLADQSADFAEKSRESCQLRIPKCFIYDPAGCHKSLAEAETDGKASPREFALDLSVRNYCCEAAISLSQRTIKSSFSSTHRRREEKWVMEGNEPFHERLDAEWVSLDSQLAEIRQLWVVTATMILAK